MKTFNFVAIGVLLFVVFKPDVFAAAENLPPAGDASQRVSVSIPVLFDAHSAEPALGLKETHVQPTYDLQAVLRSDQVWFNPQMSFTRFSPIPFVGAGIGATIGNEASFFADLGIELGVQSMISKEPFEKSQYDRMTLNGILRARRPMPFGSLGLDAKVYSLSDAVIAEEEGLETKLSQSLSYRVSPYLLWEAPAGLLLRGGVDLFYLGSAAIASKEFGLNLPSDIVGRFDLGLGWNLGRWEVWTRAQFVRGMNDPEELLYKAPLFGEDYLLSWNTFRLELVWRN